MSLTKFLKNITYHQSNADRPVMTAQQLKVLFDQAGVDIKEYINDTLTKEVDNEFFDVRFKMLESSSDYAEYVHSDKAESIFEFPTGYSYSKTSIFVTKDVVDANTNDRYKEQYNDWSIHYNDGGRPYLKLKNLQANCIYEVAFIKLKY